MGHGEWDSMDELSAVQRKMNELFERALTRTDFDAATEAGDGWSPACDVRETGDAFEIRAELPGVEQDRIDVQVDGDRLIIQGAREPEPEPPGSTHHRVERSRGRFRRIVSLPASTDRGRIEAAYRNGVLTVILPKRGGDSVRVSVD